MCEWQHQRGVVTTKPMHVVLLCVRCRCHSFVCDSRVSYSKAKHCTSFRNLSYFHLHFHQQNQRSRSKVHFAKSNVYCLSSLTTHNILLWIGMCFWYLVPLQYYKYNNIIKIVILCYLWFFYFNKEDGFYLSIEIW